MVLEPLQRSGGGVDPVRQKNLVSPYRYAGRRLSNEGFIVSIGIVADARFCTSFKKYGGAMKFIQLTLDPGFLLAAAFRTYSALYRLGGPFRLIGRLSWLITFFLFGCDISPKAQVDGSIYFPHPIGIVIGEGVVLTGQNVIYQNVTLGQNKGQYPRLHNCTVYPCAVVCGDLNLRDDVIGAVTMLKSQ